MDFRYIASSLERKTFVVKISHVKFRGEMFRNLFKKEKENNTRKRILGMLYDLSIFLKPSETYKYAILKFEIIIRNLCASILLYIYILSIDALMVRKINDTFYTLQRK